MEERKLQRQRGVCVCVYIYMCGVIINEEADPILFHNNNKKTNIGLAIGIPLPSFFPSIFFSLSPNKTTLAIR